VTAPRCIEPGCPFDASPDGGHAYNTCPAHELVRTLPPDGRCLYCRGEPRCRYCSNVAQRGPLCRVCASSRAPGQVGYQGDLWRIRDLIVAFMRHPAFAGCKFGLEIIDGEKRIVGRDGAFMIVFRHQLWAPLPERPEETL
jgi:hypothetical protein